MNEKNVSKKGIGGKFYIIVIASGISALLVLMEVSSGTLSTVSWFWVLLGFLFAYVGAWLWSGKKINPTALKLTLALAVFVDGLGLSLVFLSFLVLLRNLI